MQLAVVGFLNFWKPFEVFLKKVNICNMNFPKIEFSAKTVKTSVNTLINNHQAVERICRNLQLSKVVS